MSRVFRVGKCAFNRTLCDSVGNSLFVLLQEHFKHANKIETKITWKN